LEPGTAHALSYRLTWSGDVPAAWSGARVRKTRVGKARRDTDTIEVFVVDFDGPALAELKELPRAELSVSAGTFANLAVQRHPDIDGVRVGFELDTAGEDTIELRLGLRLADQSASEFWLFRWTKS
jgi:glucans biosynthesis protein